MIWFSEFVAFFSTKSHYLLIIVMTASTPKFIELRHLSVGFGCVSQELL
jgi:hypothetical protein